MISEERIENINSVLSGGDSPEATKNNITKTHAQIKKYQERIRKYIEANYIDFVPTHITSDMCLEEGEDLAAEAEHLLKTNGIDAKMALQEANVELRNYMDKLSEVSLALRVGLRILKVDDLFQCVEESNTAKEYLVVLDLLAKLKSLIYNESGDDVDRLFQKCECYDTIKVKYHIQAHILEKNLRQRFENLVQFTEKPFPHSKCITLEVSKDLNQLQDTVMALFQARYNPMTISDFLLENCIEPIITKPVSIEYSEDNPEHVQLVLSYSMKELSESLRPSYKQVFENIKLLLHCLANINVSVSVDQHVFSIIGDRIKQRFLTLLVNECLMNSIPETMNEFQESTLVEDVILFEQSLADSFLINTETDRDLSCFTEKFEIYFRNQFSKKVLETAKNIMQKDLQDMTVVAEKNTKDDIAKNPFLFPRCMISRSTLELIKLMERILRQPSDDDEDNSLRKVITSIVNVYMIQVPEIHEHLLESIPQQSALFYNNCMFLAQWIAKNSANGIPSSPALVKTLQATGMKYLNNQTAYQQKLVMGILAEIDLSDVHSIGVAPFKLIRQCLRQLDLLKNVWQNVLPDSIYNKTFSDLLNDFCNDIIKRVLAMEDISATVANELSELIEIMLSKAPTLFTEAHEVIHVKTWMKLEQLKMILKASMQEIIEQWCEGAGILTVNYKAEEIRHLIRALFQNTDRRAKVLAKII